MNKLEPKKHVAGELQVKPNLILLQFRYYLLPTLNFYSKHSTKLSHIASILPLSLHGFLNKVIN